MNTFVQPSKLSCAAGVVPSGAASRFVNAAFAVESSEARVPLAFYGTPGVGGGPHVHEDVLSQAYINRSRGTKGRTPLTAMGNTVVPPMMSFQQQHHLLQQHQPSARVTHPKIPSLLGVTSEPIVPAPGSTSIPSQRAATAVQPTPLMATAARHQPLCRFPSVRQATSMRRRDHSGKPPTYPAANDDSFQSGMKEVPHWLKNLRLHKYTTMFQDMSYDEMMSLSEATLERRQVTKGARRKIIQSIEKLRQRPAMIREKEANLRVRSPQRCLRCAVALSHMVVGTPIRAYRPKPDERSDLIDGTVNANFEKISDENLPALLFYLLQKVVNLAYSSPSRKDELDLDSQQTLIIVFDKIAASEAFTPIQKQVVSNWRRTAKKHHGAMSQLSRATPQQQQQRMGGGGSSHTGMCEACHLKEKERETQENCRRELQQRQQQMAMIQQFVNQPMWGPMPTATIDAVQQQQHLAARIQLQAELEQLQLANYLQMMDSRAAQLAATSATMVEDEFSRRHGLTQIEDPKPTQLMRPRVPWAQASTSSMQVNTQSLPQYQSVSARQSPRSALASTSSESSSTTSEPQHFGFGHAQLEAQTVPWTSSMIYGSNDLKEFSAFMNKPAEKELPARLDGKSQYGQDAGKVGKQEPHEENHLADFYRRASDFEEETRQMSRGAVGPASCVAATAGCDAAASTSDYYSSAGSERSSGAGSPRAPTGLHDFSPQDFSPFGYDQLCSMMQVNFGRTSSWST